MARPEFGEPPTDWLELVRKWLLDYVLQSDAVLPNWLGWLILVGGIGVVFFVLSRVLDWKPSSKRKSRKVASLLQVTDGEARDWGEALDLAGEALQKGDLRHCLWLSHRLVLFRLDQAEHIHFEQSKTNRKYLKECRSAPHSRLLENLTEAYEDVVYGHRSVEMKRVAQLFGEVKGL